MERYIGLDVHAQSCTLVVVSGSGRQLKQQVVETNGAALKQALRAIPGTKRIFYEAAPRCQSAPSWSPVQSVFSSSVNLLCALSCGDRVAGA